MALREQLQRWENLKSSSDWSGLNEQERKVVRQQFYQRNIKPLGSEAQQQFLVFDNPSLAPENLSIGDAYGAGFRGAQQRGLTGTAIRAAGIGDLEPEREALTPLQNVGYTAGQVVGALSDPLGIGLSYLTAGAAAPVARGLMARGLSEGAASAAAALGLGAAEGGVSGAGQALLEPTLQGEERTRAATQQGVIGALLGGGVAAPLALSGARQGLTGLAQAAPSPARTLRAEPAPAVAPGRVVAAPEGATDIPRLNLSGLSDKQLDTLVKKAQEDPRFRYADRVELEREQTRRAMPSEQPEPFATTNLPWGTKATPEGAAEQARLMAQRGFQKPSFEPPTEMPMMSDAAKAREQANDVATFRIISDAERAVAERKKAEAAAEAAKIQERTREAAKAAREAERAKAKESNALARQQRHYQSLTEAVRRVEEQIAKIENATTFGFEVPSQKKRDTLERLKQEASNLRARRDAVGKTIADSKRSRQQAAAQAEAATEQVTPEVPVAAAETPSAVVEPPPSPSAGEAVTPSTTELPTTPAAVDAAVPEAAVPEAAVPEAAVPEAAVPEAAVPEAAPIVQPVNIRTNEPIPLTFPKLDEAPPEGFAFATDKQGTQIKQWVERTVRVGTGNNPTDAEVELLNSADSALNALKDAASNIDKINTAIRDNDRSLASAKERNRLTALGEQAYMKSRNDLIAKRQEYAQKYQEAEQRFKSAVEQVSAPYAPKTPPRTREPISAADPVPPLSELAKPVLPDDKVIAKRLDGTDQESLASSVVQRYIGKEAYEGPRLKGRAGTLGWRSTSVGNVSENTLNFGQKIATKLESLVRDKKLTRDQADEYLRYLIRTDVTAMANTSGSRKLGIPGFDDQTMDDLFELALDHYNVDSEAFRRIYRLDDLLLYTKYRRELGLPEELSQDYLIAYKQYEGNIPEEWFGEPTVFRVGGQPETMGATVTAGTVPLQRGRVEIVTYPQQAATRQAMGLQPDINITTTPRASAPEPQPTVRTIRRTPEGQIVIEEGGRVMRLRRSLPQRAPAEPMPGTTAAAPEPTTRKVSPVEERNQALVNQENQAVTELDEMARRGQRVANMPEEIQADYISSAGEERVVVATSDVTSFLEGLKGDGRVQTLMRENEADIGRARVYDTITWDDTKQQLAELGVDSDFLKKSAYSPDRIAKNVLGIWKYQQDLIAAMRQLARKIQIGEGSPLDEVNLARLAERFQDANAQAMGVRAALGRGMNIMRAANTMEGEAGSKAVQAALNQAKTMGSRGKELAELIVGSGNNNAAIASAAMNIGNKYWNIFEEYWRNSILSGFGTQTANIIANTVATATTIPETAVAALIGGIRKDADRVYLGEVNQMIKGIIEGGIWGLQRAKEVFKTETDVLLGEGKLEFAGGAIEGELGKAVRIPSRALAAGDAFFKEVNKAAAARALLYRDARRQGLDAAAAAKYADDVRMGVKDMPKDLADEAWQRSEYQTFTNDLDKRNFLNALGNAFLRLRREYPAMSLIFPFIRTPVNVANYALDRSAFRLFPALWSAETRRALATPGAARDEAVGRIVFGTGVTAAILGLAQKGLVTGGGPVDKDEKAAWEAAGNRPYSMKIGDTTVQYNRYAPWGIIMGVAADMLEAYKIAGEDRDIATKSWDLTGKIIESIAKNIGDQTMISGLVNVTKAFSDSENYLDNMVYSVAGGVVPGVLAGAARAMDPSIKELQSLGDALKQRVPGLRQTVAPKLRPLGEERRSFEGEGVSTRIASGIIPGFAGRVEKDVVYEELNKLKYSPAKPIKTVEFGGVEYELPPEEVNRISQLAGPTIREALNQLLSDRGYQSLTDERKRDVVERIFRKVRTSARRQVLADLIETGKVNELKEKVR